MKRTVVIVCAAALMLFAAGCVSADKQAFEISSSAYGHVNTAYESTEQFGSDIYEAWRVGIYDDDDVSIEYLADQTSLSEEDISAAIDDLVGSEDVGDTFFYLMEDDLFSACVMVVSKAYELNGTAQEISDNLEAAKGEMKQLSEKYSDYEHYPALKDYYTTTQAYFDFCQNPTGSFEQVKETLNDYKNDAREQQNDLNFVFE